jgi:thermitase
VEAPRQRNRRQEDLGGAVRLALFLFVVLGAALPASAAAQRPDAVPDEVVVRFDPGVGGTARSDARSDARVNVVRGSRLPGVQLVKVREGQTVAAAIRELEADPRVRYAEPNYIYEASAIPNDTDWLQLHGLDQANDADIDAPEAWDLTMGDSDIVVAVIDTGIAHDHNDLAGNMWANPGEVNDGDDDDGNGLIDDVRGYDFVDAGDEDPRDVNGHGSHVAGTIGAVGNNANGITGVNWDVSLMAVRVLGAAGFGSTLDIAEGFDYAGDEGADVANASLGGPGGSQAMAQAIAAHPNTLYVVAAGNEGANNEVTPSFPCNLTQLNLICVAATTVTDTLANFSNIGATMVDLGAPGTDIRSSIPRATTELDEDFEVDPTGRWVTGGSAPWGWVLSGTGNHFITDSPAGAYAANADSFTATANAVPDSSIGCTMSFLASIDVEEGFDFVVVESAPGAGGPWRIEDVFTGTFLTTIDGGFDAAGANRFVRFRLVADNTLQQDGVSIDDVVINCVQAGASNDYDNFQGTSMASPHVAGVAALALALRPGLTVSQLRDVLLSSGDPRAALAGKTVTGRRLNARNALNPPPSRVPTTGVASAITASGATLNGAVNPLGTATAFQFQLGTTTAYGMSTSVVSAGAGVGARAVSRPVSGLAPSTTYHYRAVWIRGAERAFGADRTFTTAAAPPPPVPKLGDIVVDRCRQSGRGRRTRLRCTLEQADALVRARLTLKKGRRTVARGTVRPNSSDTLALKLKRRLGKGRYVLTLRLIDSAGNVRPVQFRFRVR